MRRVLVILLVLSFLALITVGPGLPYRATKVVSVELLEPRQGSAQAWIDSNYTLERNGYHLIRVNPNGRSAQMWRRVWAFWRLTIPPPHDW